jgi:hypothetical protein
MVGVHCGKAGTQRRLLLGATLFPPIVPKQSSGFPRARYQPNVAADSYGD